jgi:hypothetical protein
MGEHSAGTIPERADREKNKEKMRERRRLRLQSDPAFRERECARDREWKRRKRYEQVYGISLADYDAMLERQSDAYAICKKSDEALLPRVQRGAWPPLRQVQQRARVLQRQSRASLAAAATCWLHARRRRVLRHRLGWSKSTGRRRARRERARSPMPVIVAAQAKPYESGVT